MTRLGLLSAACATILCTAVAAASCGAVAFELPPEEPPPEAASPQRLVRHDAGTREPHATSDPSP